MARYEYAVHVRALKRSKLFVATSPDIRGLVLEVKSVDELHTELLRVTERLLKTNHGLTDEQIANVQLNVTVLGSKDRPSATQRPRILFDDQRAVSTVA